MAFADFYIQTTGNDVNAGSTSADAALVTDVGGTYNQGTGAGGTDRYTASAGTPFSATVVGEYVSVYTAGATVATFVGQITAVNASGASLDISLTIIYGTRPANASTKTAKTGGAWASMAGPAGLGSFTIPQSTRLNIKAGTYANTTNNRNIQFIGTTTLPFWVRGYNSSPGDLDAIPTTTRTPGTNMPSVTFTSGGMTFTGAFTTISSVSFLATAATLATLIINGANSRLHRVRAENQNAAAGSRALNFNSGSNIRIIESWLKATTTATEVVNAGVVLEFYACAFEGGVNNVTASTSIALDDCIFANAVNYGLSFSGNVSLSLNGCTFYGSTDGVHIGATVPLEAVIFNCLFHTLTNGINNSSGTNTDKIHRASNTYYNVSTPETGFGDSVEFDRITESSDPCIVASSLNFTIKPTAKTYQAAAPQLFENQSNNVSYMTGGAVQPNPPIGAVTQKQLLGSAGGTF